MKQISLAVILVFFAQLVPAAAFANCPDLKSKDGNRNCTTSCTCVDEEGGCGCCTTHCEESAQPASPAPSDPEPKDKRSKGSVVNLVLGVAVIALAGYLIYSLAKNRNDVNNNLSSNKDIEPRGLGFAF